MKTDRNIFAAVFSAFLLAFPLAAEGGVSVSVSVGGDFPMSERIPDVKGSSGSSAQALPGGFGAVKLGMSVDDVKEMLKQDSRFGYRGDRDVSLLPGDNRVLIETDTSRTAPYSYLDRCWFQFYEDKLYTITINMNRDKLDHYSVFSTLCEKYGNPVSLNPDKAEWRDGSVIIDLERPLALKYTDRAVFEKLQADAMVDKTAGEKSRENFLEGL